ncbi:MAG: hypothetical protein HONBIEJF_00069 [Fimbriimonadaceae bacterium]|nr:hypothetical protein [Fimbriimonadaceae bacterium]
MQFSIRPASQADSPGVVSVIQAVYEEYGFSWEAEGYNADLYDIEGHYLAKGHRFWVAEDSEGVVQGTTALKTFPTIPGGDGPQNHHGKVRIAGADCSLERLYVHPAARRVGMGIALFELVVEAARSDGCSRMEIWSDKKLTKAHALYEKYGAVRVAERICDDPDESPEWGMRLDLVK